MKAVRVASLIVAKLAALPFLLLAYAAIVVLKTVVERITDDDAPGWR